jgi:hypothetical protein
MSAILWENLHETIQMLFNHDLCHCKSLCKQRSDDIARILLSSTIPSSMIFRALRAERRIEGYSQSLQLSTKVAEMRRELAEEIVVCRHRRVQSPLFPI